MSKTSEPSGIKLCVLPVFPKEHDTAMNNHSWSKVREFEYGYKKKSLRRMSQKESLGIFLDLYQLSQELRDKKHYSTLNRAKIKSLGCIQLLSKGIK